MRCRSEQPQRKELRYWLARARELGVEALEVAILDRTRAMPRKFRRIKGDRLAALLANGPGATGQNGGEERQPKPAT